MTFKYQNKKNKENGQKRYVFCSQIDLNFHRKQVVPERNINGRKVVVLEYQRPQPRVKSIGHDLKTSFLTGDDEVDVIASALFRTHR